MCTMCNAHSCFTSNLSRATTWIATEVLSPTTCCLAWPYFLSLIKCFVICLSLQTFRIATPVYYLSPDVPIHTFVLNQQNCNKGTISHHLLRGMAILFVFNQQSSSIQCCSIVHQCGLKTKLIALLSVCHCKPGKHFKLFAENPKGTSPLGRHRPSTQRTQRAAPSRKTHGLPTNKEQSLRRKS